MARPRIPTKILEMRGSFKKDPQRQTARANEPTDLPLPGDPHSTLTDDQKKAWAYILERCPAGVLRQSDEIALEACARLYAEMRVGTIDRTGTKQLMDILSKFGMTPSDRSRVSAGDKPKVNKFANIG